MKYTPAITVQQATGPFYFNGGAPWFDDPNEAQRWADTNAHCFMLPLKVLDQSTYYKWGVKKNLVRKELIFPTEIILPLRTNENPSSSR